MKFGLNLYSLSGQIATEEGFLETLIKLKELGYEYVQLSGRPLDGEITKRVSEKSGMPVILSHTPLDKIKDETEWVVNEHKKFGTDRVGLGYYPMYDQDEKAIFEKIKTFGEIADKVSKAGARFYYHNHHFEFRKLSDGKTIFDHYIEDYPNVNFIMDTYWLQTGGVNILEYIDKCKGRIECVHLKDYRVVFDENGKFEAKYAPVGDGNINWKEVIPAFIKAGAKYFLVEQDDATIYPDPFEQVGRSIKYLKENF